MSVTLGCIALSSKQKSQFDITITTLALSRLFV
jgi:hypothetical protein